MSDKKEIENINPYKEMFNRIEKSALSYIEENNLDMKNLKIINECHEFEVKAASEDDDRKGITIEGYLSTFKNIDRHNDIVEEDAFKKTIRGLKKLPMLMDHWASIDHQVGSWTKFKVDDYGLKVKGFISETPKTEHLITMIKDGHVDTLSMGGIFSYDETRDKNGNWLIKEVILLEGSVVAIPANAKATFTQKSLGGKSSQVDESNGEKVQKLEDLLKKDLSEDKKIVIKNIIKEMRS